MVFVIAIAKDDSWARELFFFRSVPFCSAVIFGKYVRCMKLTYNSLLHAFIHFYFIKHLFCIIRNGRNELIPSIFKFSKKKEKRKKVNGINWKPKNGLNLPQDRYISI